MFIFRFSLATRPCKGVVLILQQRKREGRDDIA
jgi:hypothetical protein